MQVTIGREGGRRDIASGHRAPGTKMELICVCHMDQGVSSDTRKRIEKE